VSRIEAAVWRALDVGRPSGEKLAERLAVPDVTPRLLAALDADARRHLLVPLQPDDEEQRDTRSRGVSVLTKELSVRGRSPARYLDIECHDATGHEAFDLIGGELAEGLKIADAKPVVLTARVLAKWRRFWGQLPRQMLSREEQLGLFAELWFLSVWLIPRVGIIKALAGWRGPFGAARFRVAGPFRGSQGHNFNAWPRASHQRTESTRSARKWGVDVLQPSSTRRRWREQHASRTSRLLSLAAGGGRRGFEWL